MTALHQEGEWLWAYLDDRPVESREAVLNTLRQV